MKTNYTKLLGIILTAALLLTAAIALASCGPKNVTSEIYITKSDLPRTDYVEGQDLDLSKGKLTVVTDGVESKFPLTAPEITVTGYDKDVVGEQTITVKYLELTTTFTVKVAERTVAQDFETKYFVGGEFNPAKGKIKVTTDDAKSFLVNMSDPTVSLVSFDSSVAGTATVTLLYNNGVNAYYCQFDVTVYEQSNIEFTAPQKTDYVSHYEGKPDVSGGYFKVTSSDSTLTMNVPVTEAMVSGFDPAAATVANRETPLEQTLTVTYLGKTFNYNVYITFSGLSMVNQCVADLAEVDIAKAQENGLTDRESALAIIMINEFYALTDEHKALISDETKARIGALGAIAVNGAFGNEFATYSNSLKMSEDKKIYFIKSSYEQTAADVQRLNDPEENINVYAELLRQIVADFGEVALSDTVKVKDYVSVYTEDMEILIKEVLNHLVEVFGLLKDIPAEWDAESLKPYGENIRSAVLQMHVAEYYKNGNTAYYTNILSPWRENNDLFELLYTYFLYDYENGAEFMAKYMWGNMPLPGKLNDWYNGLKTSTALSASYQSYVTSNKYYIDLSPYMFNYFRTLEICEEIKNSGNQFWIDLYNAYNGDNMNRVYLYTYSFGYLYHTKGMVDSDAYKLLWDNFYDVLKLYNNNTLSSETHKKEIMAVYSAFEALDPSELLGFLSSLSLQYTNGKGQMPMLGHTLAEGEEDKAMVYNLFAYVLSNNYSSYLTETNKTLFNDLLYAMETFVLIGYKDGASEEFNTKMSELSEKIAALEGDDRTNFEEYFDDLYNKYYSLYEISSGKTKVELNEEETKLVEEYIDTLDKFFTVYSNIYLIIQNGNKVSDDAYPILYALYARASELRAQLFAMGSDTVDLSMYVTEYEIGAIKYSLEKGYFLADSVTTSVLTSMSAIVSLGDGKVGYATYWDLYKSESIEKLLAKMSHVLYYAYFDGGKTFDNAELVALMNEMRGYDIYNSSVVVLLNIDDTFYRALTRYYDSVLTDEGVAANAELVNVARAYTTYALTKNDDNLKAFKTAFETVKPLFEKLSAEDKAYMQDAYDYYSDLYAELTAK